MFADVGTPFFWTALMQIIGINILLSGDNAVVIALASRSLPDEQRKWAILGGSGAAIVLRIIFSLVIVWLLAIPFLKLIGGLLLLYIGIKLLVPEEHGDDSIAAKSNLWGAIQTITIADAVMSLDNVVAIAAAAQGSIILIVLGLIISVPLIIFGSQLVLSILNRFPVLVIAGGGLLGWIAGEIIVSDEVVNSRIPYDIHTQELVARPVLAAFVVIVGMLLARRAKKDHVEVADLAPEDKQ